MGEFGILFEQPPLDLGQDALLVLGQRHVRLRPGSYSGGPASVPGEGPPGDSTRELWPRTCVRGGTLKLRSGVGVAREDPITAGAGGLAGLLVGLGRTVGGEGGQVDRAVAKAGPDG